MGAGAQPVRWRSGAASDRGAVRAVNQDAYLDRPDLGLWVVADGMGGHARGERASRLLVDRLAGIGHQTLLGVAVASIRRVLREVNAQLRLEASAQDQGVIGSTVVALVAVASHGALLWAGDSRAYRLRDGQLVQLTVDHTHVQLLVARGMLTPEQAARHPLASVLVRAVGGSAELELDCQIESLRAGDRLLLCSDGLVNELSLEQIIEHLAGTTPAAIATALVAAAVAAGGRDNVTVIVVDVEPAPGGQRALGA
ncbi:MAG: serine/threonine-protein phosphatase [Sphingobacteriia bacterium]|nr:serine/threonine-protein phosphatase [Sphingobacteriia bacterium]NCC38922.1 serine/threonine-protein phosphatase [Gammaproteobacteria bacterium]